MRVGVGSKFKSVPQSVLHLGLICGLLMMFAGVQASGEELVFRQFSINDGLPRNQVNVIFADRTGFVWFGTSDGLSRFDGYGFTNFGVDQGLPHTVDSALPA